LLEKAVADGLTRPGNPEANDTDMTPVRAVSPPADVKARPAQRVED
jgi:hypothetical protein